MPVLSVLDQSPIRAGGTPAQAVAETIELARFCESLGYHRYWLAEHHNSDGLAGTDAERDPPHRGDAVRAGPEGHGDIRGVHEPLAHDALSMRSGWRQAVRWPSSSPKSGGCLPERQSG